MDEQEAVETQVEQTTETESAPVETNTEVTQEAPVVSNDTEKNVSQSVPYERFKEYVDKYHDLEDKVTTLISGNQAPQPQYQNNVELDPDVVPAVRSIAEQIVVEQKVADFRAKHADELSKDEVLDAQVEREMRKQQAQGRRVDPESAYQTAKALLDSRFKPVVEQAKQEGVKEGQDIAKTKQQLGAVGETGKQPEVSDDNLSSAELAKKYGIPRAN